MMFLATDVGWEGGLAPLVAGADGVGLVFGVHVYVLVCMVAGVGTGMCRLTCSFGLLGDPVALLPLSLLGDLCPDGYTLGPWDSWSAFAHSTMSSNPATICCCRVVTPLW